MNSHQKTIFYLNLLCSVLFFKSAEGKATEYFMKMLIIGDSRVGKSSILNRYIHDEFDPSKECTIGIDFAVVRKTVDQKEIKLHIWDTAGSERFLAITRSYLRGSKAIMLSYDISDASTFNNLPKWLNIIRRDAEYDVNILLVGNKSDLTDKRQVSFAEGKKFADDNGMEFIETSAKNDDQIDLAFQTLLENSPLTVREAKAIKLKKDNQINFNCCF